MSPLLMKAVIAITLALIFYTIGVWAEHRKKLLKPLHLAFFWCGFLMDATGTHLMSEISDAAGGQSEGGALMNLHGITGLIAILLMLVHAIWATTVIIRKDENAQRNFHKFSLTVWCIWLIPFFLGMMMGMMG